MFDFCRKLIIIYARYLHCIIIDRSEKCEINQSLTQRISSRTIIIKGLISLPIGIIINKKNPLDHHRAVIT